MLDKWKKQICMMLIIRDKLFKADKEHLWEYYYPEVAANIRDIQLIQKKMKIKLSDEYAAFLMCANGWKCFYHLVDLFGTEDFQSDNMIRAREMLDAELKYDEELLRIKEYLLPIAVSRTDKDLFIMILKDGKDYGKIIWLAGGEIEWFASFGEFFEAMIAYNIEELQDLLTENSN